MSLNLGHPFKGLFYRIWCASTNYPLGGGVALWLSFLLICLLSPAPALLSQGWPQTPSSFPVEEHTDHKHETHTHTHTHRVWAGLPPLLIQKRQNQCLRKVFFFTVMSLFDPSMSALPILWIKIHQTFDCLTTHRERGLGLGKQANIHLVQ